MPSKAENDRVAILNAEIREVMSTPAGRNFIWEILCMCPLNQDIFTGNSATFHLSGKLAIGIGIIGLLEDADPKIYPKLLMEKQNG